MKKDLYINGVWTPAQSYTALYSPYSKEQIAEVAEANAEEAKQAITAAYEARDTMRNMPAHRRAAILEKLAQLLQERSEEAARLIATEGSKPLSAARGEIARTIETYKFAAEEAKRIHGETIPLDAAATGEGRTAYTVKEPVGVVGAITPFNFPMNLVAHKVGPGIAAGNTIVLKPAEQTPLSSLLLAELLEEAGLPAGALNVVTGDGKTVGDVIVTDERVKALSFTGSPAVGISIRARAGLKKVTLELGSNSGLIIDADTDIAGIMDRVVSGAFSNQGQVCISVQRIYVHEQIYDHFVKQFVEKTAQLKMGDPLAEDTDVAAMIAPKEQQRAIEWINEAVEQGAEIAYGGKVENELLLPTVLLNVQPQSKIACREVFAPIVMINRVSGVDEAIAAVNQSDYGLQAGIYTKQLDTAFRAVHQLEVGGVIINDIPTFRVDHMPYGGVKQSGTGREGIKYAMEEMMETKLVVFKHQR
ncbi:aldehyde dehydrogenase family protein [Paenibacillus bovis]|uniref:Aldehyde dehydrogenase n=1 Tax=Paenibacillus bovis TaxID=1616788 RepID=A0A172ZHZ9_9BACL|nr:aldehyde dehydrogenase family protein [Paenibacillus bovis]ANF96917.1 aldehyde dehydrogenase [Paenibacillus bovis]